ncbi:MAG: NAD-dependent epimerase/dehydratase family protein, partial [Planctomycetota bacterium]
MTGGAGYVGAHMLLALSDAGEKAVALDDLSTGAEWMAPPGAELIVGDVGDRALLERVFDAHDIDAVIHFAGSTKIAESLVDPLKYYRNNTAKTLTLIEACVAHGVGGFIFSSTASVYGRPEQVPVSESAMVNSITPYGASMAMSERILADAAATHALA